MGLQFGHGDEAVEDRGIARDFRSTTRGFNLATAMKPWKTPLLAWIERAHISRFNLATAMKPWKTRDHRRRRAITARASIWPRR